MLYGTRVLVKAVPVQSSNVKPVLPKTRKRASYFTKRAIRIVDVHVSNKVGSASGQQHFSCGGGGTKTFKIKVLSGVSWF